MNALDKDFRLCSLLSFALPSMITMLFMGFYTIMDTIFVSQLVNTIALSSLNMVCPIINLIVGLGTMLATGSSALIAKDMGEGNQLGAKQKFTWITICCLGIGCGIMAIGILMMDDILRLLGVSSIQAPYAKDYLQIIFLFTPACMMQVLFQSLIITAGKPKLGMLLSVGAGILNVALDYLLIVYGDMGIRGSALGTGFGYLAPCLIGAYVFSQKDGSLSFCKTKPQPIVLWKSCTNGCSEMISQASAAVTTFLFNMVVMKLQGEQGVAAITMMIYTQFLLTTLYIGFSMGVAPVLSFAYGAQNKQRVTRLLHDSCLTIFLLSLFTFLFCFFFRSFLVQLFTPPGSAVYELAVDGFAIFSFSFLCCGFNIFASAYFTALSNGLLSAIISFLRTFGFLCIGILCFASTFGMDGIWMSIPFAETGALLVAMLCFFYHKKHVTI